MPSHPFADRIRIEPYKHVELVWPVGPVNSIAIVKDSTFVAGVVGRIKAVIEQE